MTTCIFPMFSAAVLALGLLPDLARAESRVVNVAAGKRSSVGTFGTYHTGQCTAGGVPEARIARAPANGRLEIVEERRVMRAARCGGIAGNVLVIYYTPAKGFRGADAAAVDFTSYVFAESSRVRSTRLDIAISVK